MPTTAQIVTVNVSVTEAANAINLQQTGAFISMGGTSAAKGSLTKYATLAALVTALAAPVALASLTWSGGVVTGTTTTPHGWTTADAIPLSIAGVTPAGYNGTYNATISGASTFTFPLTANPGAVTVEGTVTLGSVPELTAMATTYFAGLNPPAPFVLEFGEGTATEGTAALTAWLAANPLTVYAFLVPREWVDSGAFLTLAELYDGPSAMTYFFVTMLTDNITNGATQYTGQKDVFGLIEAPSIPLTEFSAASPFASFVSQNPGSTNRATSLAYAPAYGVTPWPAMGNSGTFNTFSSADVGWIGTGAAGGISSNILFQGLLQDGNQALFWYSADWFNLNINQALANELINGAAPGNLAPLVYNQDGINRLQNRLLQTAQQAVSYGLAQGLVVGYSLPGAVFGANYDAGMYEGQIPINAEPFAVYTAENPNDYRAGRYAGLAAAVTPQLGFINLFFNLNITNILVP
jgi:hypothetical protein